METRPSALGLTDVITGLTGAGPSVEFVPNASGRQIRTAVIDSRLATPGCLFVALKGTNQDGHDFVEDAVTKGAIAVIAERAPQGAVCQEVGPAGLRVCNIGDCVCFIVADSLAALQQVAAYWRRQHEVRVIGITGSIGKTTSKEVIAAVLSKRFNTLRSAGNYNNEIGLPLTLLHLSAAHERVVLEMGMYDLGEIADLVRIALPQVGVVTNVGPSHLGRLGSIERIAQAKAELPRGLPPAGEGGVAILNADDALVQAMAEDTLARVFTYGLDPRADLWADHIESEGLEGIRFRFHYGPETIHAHVPMLGQHSVHTALRAAAVGLEEGLSWEEIMAGLRDQSAQLRLMAVPGPSDSIILDDTYNSSPASCIAALNLLDDLGGHKIAVLGDMYELGRYEAEAHKLVGRRARMVADRLITVGTLGRIMGEEALKAGMPADSVYMTADNAEAIDLLTEILQESEGNDRVLIKGSRGLEMEEIVAALTRASHPAHRQTRKS